MQAIFARRARLEQGWVSDLRLTVAEGRIASLQSGAAAKDGDTCVDTLVPALANLHSPMTPARGLARN